MAAATESHAVDMLALRRLFSAGATDTLDYIILICVNMASTLEAQVRFAEEVNGWAEQI